MIKRKFFGKKSHGRFVLHDRKSYEDYLAKFDEGRELEMTIGAKYKRRTQGAPGEDTNFNGYYWGVVVRIISDEMGEIDDQATHSLLQMLFNKRGITVIDPVTKRARNVEIPKGTSELSGIEFAEYCSKIRIWASMPGNMCEAGCYIPEPHEVVHDGMT